jgi:hypothetical protein
MKWFKQKALLAFRCERTLDINSRGLSTPTLSEES